MTCLGGLRHIVLWEDDTGRCTDERTCSWMAALRHRLKPPVHCMRATPGDTHLRPPP